MIDIFKNLLQFIKYKKCYIDESIFRLHCTYTSMILFFFFLVITAKQLTGDPIDCDTNRDSVKPSVLNTFCLIHYTFTMESGFNQRIGAGNNVAAPGVWMPREGDKEIRYNYYQWIWFVFFVEAVFFYIPRWLWKSWESGTINHLVSGVTGFMNEKEREDKHKLVIYYLLKNRKVCNSLARDYLFCQILALINILFQMLFIDYLFNGEFYTYGLRVFKFLSEDPNERRDALIKVCIQSNQ